MLRYRDGYDKPPVWMEPGKVYKVTLQPMTTSNYFAAGHRIRIEVSSSNFPRFDRNFNTGGNNLRRSEGRGGAQRGASFEATSVADHSNGGEAAFIIPAPQAKLSSWPADNGTLEQITKQQLVEAVSAKTGQGRAEVEAVVDSILGTITEALSSNERVDVRGFGSFVVKDKKERQGHNPRTGETITIAAKRDVGFRPGKELSEMLTQAKPEVMPA